MLDEEAVVALLGILDEQAPDIPALPVLRAIVHYGVEPDAMAEVGERILERLDVGADNRLRPEYLRAMRELLVPRAEQRLREIAAALDDPESFTAASLLGASPSAADDPIAPHVPVLASRAERGDDVKAVRELAWLPLEQYGVQADVFVKALSSKDIDSRVWASIAIAKLGDPAPLLQVLRDLPAGPPAWMWGNPWTAYNMVSRARPVPEQVRATLLSLHEDDLDRDQRIIAWALTGTKTAEGQEIETEPPEPPAHPVPAEELDTDAFLASVRAATSQGDYERLPLDDLPRADSLSPDQHAEVVSRLVWASMREDRRSVADGWGNATMDALGRARTLPLDVDGILATYIDALGTRMNQRQLGAVLSRADDDGVVHSVVQALRDAPNARTANDLAYLLDYASVGDVVYVGAGPPPLLQAIPPLSILPPEFQAPAPAPTAPAPAPSGQMPPPAPTPEPAPPRSARGIGWPWKWLRRRRLRVEVGGDSLQLDPGPSGPPVLVRYAAHPCIALDDDVVVIGEEFTVTLGLAAMPTPGVASPGAIAVEVEVESFPIDDLEVELVVDPESVEVLGGQRVFPLNVRGMDDFPVHAVRLRALFTPGLDQDRRIAVLYRRGGRVVGFAFRMVRAVENDAARRRSDPPAPIKESVLDLAPLVDDGPPDLLLCLFHGDAPDSYVWGIYPRSGTAVPDLRRGGRLPDARDFATYTQRAVRSRDFKGGKAYDQLVGYGIQIDDVMPTLVTEAIRDAVAAAPDRAPSVLLLTQEPFVPWELAVPTPRLTSTYGGDSPFVGAHAAISRWPLSENQKPVLTRLPTVTVSRQAAITADYTGVKAWPPLEHARAEVRELVGLYGMTEVGASREELRACLTGDTAFDVIHVALHGQRDPQGLEDGLVLLEPDASGNPGPTFFNATQVLGLENHASQPFVFLNACQVGSGEAVLGTYAGFAINLLRTRASAVVAPLWNVDDNVAAAITRDFYDSAYAEEPAPVAEILRRVRASYTEAGVQADPESCTPTLVAYQCFGHPHFTLRRHPAGEMEEQP